MLYTNKKEIQVVIVVLVVTLITEIVDDILDSILGNSILHSLIQILLFLFLLFIISKIYKNYYKTKIKKMIPSNLREILLIVSKAEDNNTIINFIKIRKELNITKPTLKKRVDGLISLNYVSIEKSGNNKYLRITELGKSILN